MPLHRARENSTHPRGKADLGRLVSRRGFLVLYEHKLADVVAFRSAMGGVRIVCGEHDQRVYTVSPNVQRNFRNGCHAMVILVPDEYVRATVRRRLCRDFPRSIWTRVGIVTHEICQQQLARPVHSESIITRKEQIT
jgi:hypothetical protein